MAKTSIGKILSGFEWDYDGPVRFVTGKGYQGKGISRTMFLSPSNLADIPEELFAVKLSQSVKAERAGKPVFRFFSYRFTPGEGAYQDLAPTGITLDTPNSQICRHRSRFPWQSTCMESSQTSSVQTAYLHCMTRTNSRIRIRRRTDVLRTGLRLVHRYM